MEDLPKLSKVVINGIDVSDYIYKYKFSKAYNQSVKTGEININKNVNNILLFTNLLIGKSVTIQRGVLVATERYIFRGEIVSLEQVGSTYKVVIADKLYAASRREYDYTYDKNTDTSAGVGSAIATDLLDQIDLPYTTNTVIDTTTDADKVIAKYPVRGKIIESLKDLASIYNYILFYKDSDNNVYFKPEGYDSTTTVLETGYEIINRIQWIDTGEDLVNNLTLTGGEQLDWNEQVFSPGTLTSVFTLAAKPVDSDIYVNGVKKLRGVPPSDNKDFVVDSDKKTITLTTAVTGTVTAYYSYNVPVKVSSTDYNSITNYGQHDNTIVNDKLTNTNDAELRAIKYLEENAEVITSAPLRVVKNNDLEINQLITIQDDVNNITKEVVVKSIEYSYPYKGDQVTVGKIPIQSLDIQLNIIDNIRKLQRQLSNDTDIDVQLFNNPDDFEFFGYHKNESAVPDAGVLYWDSDVQGTWDDFNWGDDNEETYSAQSLIPVNKIIYEDFRSTEFKDAGNTTATWTTTGACAFTSAQTAQSVYYLKDLDLTIAQLTLTTSYTGTITFYVSADGTNWKAITNGQTLALTNTGSYIYWKAVESGSSTASINYIQITY